MELELRHLAPYLPYKLKIQGQTHKEIAILSCCTETAVNIEGHSFQYGMWADVYDIKPILRPLSDLTKEIEVRGKKFVPLGSVLVQKYPKWFQEHQGSKNYTNITLDFSGRFATAFLTFQATHEVQIDSTYLENTPYLIFKKLIEWHFDVFGLIENGLAIDINTLNEQL